MHVAERGCILEHQTFRSAKMILRDRCSTSYDLASLFRGRHNTLERWDGTSQNALARGRQLCTQLSILKEVCRKFFVLGSRRSVSFWTCKLPLAKEVSHSCFLSDRSIDKWMGRERDRDRGGEGDRDR